MHRDLRILLWIFTISLLIFIVYTLVGLAFDALDKPSSTLYYKTYKAKFSDVANDTDPDIKPDRNWRPRREPLPFLGYVHYSIVMLITGIFVVVILGFLVIYLANKRINQ
jgi:hypothetical protein